VSTPLEDGLAWALRIGQHLGVDVDHYLVAAKCHHLPVTLLTDQE
jgi:hypothetical protein